jgi:L-iditol 2-dehydrogenase
MSQIEQMMRQAVMVAPGNIQFRTVAIPAIRDDEVLVKVMRIGVCGSDIHVYHGKHPYTPFPVVQGHETSCEVAKVGANVTGLEPGDKVTIEPQVSCGACYSCKNGLYNICDNLKVIGFQTTGAASDYFPVPANKLVKMPAWMSHDEGAMIEPLAVGVRAVQKAGDVEGKNILVYGAGPIGNLVAQTAKALGAAEIMIVDLNDKRLEIARMCGMEHTVNPRRENLTERLAAAWGTEKKADCIFECAGAEATIQSAIENARKGTDIVVVAVYGKPPQVDMALVNEAELKIIGTARYVIDDFRTAISLVEAGKVQLKPLVTDVFAFERYDDAYHKIENDPETTMKMLIQVNDDGG